MEFLRVLTKLTFAETFLASVGPTHSVFTIKASFILLIQFQVLWNH